MERVTWRNRSVQGPQTLRHVKELVRQLARASVFAAEYPDATPWHRRLVALRDLAFVYAELSIAAVCVAVMLSLTLPLIYAIASHQLDSPTLGTSRLVSSLVQVGGLAAAVSAATFMAGCVALAVARRTFWPVWEGVRRLFVAVIRPVVLACYLPFAVPWRGVLVFLVLVPIAFLALGAIVIPVSWFLSIPMGSWAPFMKLGAVYIGLLLAALTIPAVAAAVGAPVLKILLDIFRYATSPAYRNRVQALVDEAIGADDASERRTTILIAHSLGSVIAVDSLLNSAAWTRDDRVVLVTLGSPLKRFFFRFFPNLYVPPDADRCAAQVAQRIGAFLWVNCYRPCDYVGTAIGLSATKYSRDVSTGQTGRRPIHTGYWTDMRVRDLVAASIDEMSFTEPSEAARQEPVMSFTFHAPHRAAYMKWTGRALLLLPVVVLLSGLVRGAVGWTEEYRRRTANLEALSQQAVTVDGDLSYWEETHFYAGRGGTHVIITEWYQIDYRDQQGRLVTWVGEGAADDLLSKQIWHFDGRRMNRSLKEIPECARGFRKAPTKGRPCSYGGVRVSYFASQPETFILTDFPPTWGLWSWISTLFTQLGVSMMLAVVLGGLTLYGFAATVLLIGENAMSDDDLTYSWRPEGGDA